MYTAELARGEPYVEEETELDRRLREAVFDAQKYGARQASIRVYIDDPFCQTIAEELKKRGFTPIVVPEIILKGDVDFSW